MIQSGNTGCQQSIYSALHSTHSACD